jgi:hypothetical protein
VADLGALHLCPSDNKVITFDNMVTVRKPLTAKPSNEEEGFIA